MTQINKKKGESGRRALKVEYIVLGAAVVLLLVLLFLAGAEDTTPECGELWMITPLLIVPVAGIVYS